MTSTWIDYNHVARLESVRAILNLYYHYALEDHVNFRPYSMKMAVLRGMLVEDSHLCIFCQLHWAQAFTMRRRPDVLVRRPLFLDVDLCHE